MGGSGGGGGTYSTPSFEKIKDMIDKSKDQTSRDDFKTQLNNFTGDLLKDFNNRDRKATENRLIDIITILKDVLEAELPVIFGGSVSKHTFVNGLSDIDSLLVINNTELATKSPQDVINFVATKLCNSKLKATGGKLAVTVKYPDGMEIQLLPAIKQGRSVKISNFSGTGWSDINPKGFTDKLTKVNKQCNSNVVPVIKLVKSINSNFPEKLQLSGYHIESLAIEAFKNYKGSFTAPEMLSHFFKASSTNVLSKIKDSTGQSVHVDDYLGDKNSKVRQSISHLLKRTHLKMDNATVSSSLEDWKELFDEE